MKKRAPAPHKEDTVTLLDGRKLGYAEFGKAEGRPLLWFHGTPGGRYQIPPDLPEEASRRGFRVITVERPGAGDSTHKRGRTLLSFTDDIVQLLDHLNIQLCAIIGLSGGGPYVMACGHEMPKRMVAGVSLGGMGPVCEEGAPEYWPYLSGVMKHFAPFREVLSLMLNPLLKSARFATSPGYDLYATFGPKSDRTVLKNPAMKTMFCRDIVHATKHGIRSFTYDVSIFGQPWGFHTKDIQTPIRIWHGDADSVVPLAHSVYLQRSIPDCKLTVVPNLGHFAGFVGIDAVLDDVKKIWDDKAQAAA